MQPIVITPTYNEKDNIIPLIQTVMQVPGDFDYLVVDDNSPDGTAEMVAALAEETDRVHLIRRAGPRGFGPSYVDGFRYALDNGYDPIMCMDADFSHDPADLPSLLNALDTYDVVLGSRYCDGRVSVVNWPWFRLFLSMFAGKYVRMVTGLDAFDPTSGFRAFRASALSAIEFGTLRSNGYCFQVEVLHRAKRCGLSVGEVPIIFTERRDGHSKMSKRIMLEAALMPWRLRLSRFRPNRRTANTLDSQSSETGAS